MAQNTVSLVSSSNAGFAVRRKRFQSPPSTKTMMLPETGIVRWKRRRHAQAPGGGNVGQWAVSVHSVAAHEIAHFVMARAFAHARTPLEILAPGIKTSSSELGPILMILAARPDHLLSATFVPPNRICLTFADDRTGEWSLATLGIETAYLRLPTMRAADDGTALEVEMSHGETVQIDAGAIRSAIDPDYARRVRESLIAMRGPIEAI